MQQNTDCAGNCCGNFSLLSQEYMWLAISVLKDPTI